MGIQFYRGGIFDSMNCRYVEPAYLIISKTKIKEYLKTHPYPNDPAYRVEDMMGDLQTTGSWMLPEGIKEETGEFIANMVQELL
jgi:hypothetical protein